MKYKKELWSLLGVGVLFLGASYLAERNAESLKALIAASGLLGLAAYFLIEFAAVVVAPFSSLPFLPLAVAIWGSFWAAIISYVAWLSGSVVAFWLAHRFGRPLVKRLASIDKVERIESSIKPANLFWTIVILRIALPVDILSYALGLFFAIRFELYFWATALGILPFAFLFAYAVTLPLAYQALIVVLGLAVSWWGFKKTHLI